MINFIRTFMSDFQNWPDSLFNNLFAYCGLDKTKSIPPIDPGTIGKWMLFFILGLIAVLILLRIRKVFNIISRNISYIAILVWLAGVFTYIVGFYNDDITALSVIPRAVLSSFKMFVGSNELARVHEGLRNNPCYMSFFSVIHFLAACITSMFLFQMVGFKVRCWFNIRIHRWFKSKRRVVHLFWGVNEESLLLAEDIREIEKNKPESQKSTIIFIDVDEETADNSKRKINLAHITDVITVTDSEINRLLDVKALVGHCYNGPALLDDDRLKDVFGALNLKAIRHIVRKSSASYFYFMSDNEDMNLIGALNLQKDQRLLEMSVLPEIYVHASRDSRNEIFDHYSMYDSKSKRMKIKVIDSAFLAITDLKQSEGSLPVNCMNPDKKTGLVDSPFTSLIIGFGQTGQEAFKFLYEFSAFVGPDMKKSKFKCYAIDEKMDGKRGLFKVKMPDIDENELVLLKMSVNSTDYWDKIGSVINELNYVVISLNDDVIGLSTAVEFFKFALKSRSANAPLLKIMVRCYKSSSENKMSEAIRNLNSSVKDSNFNISMSLFGEEKGIFKVNNTLHNSIVKGAKVFHYVYSNPDLSCGTLWEDIDESRWEKQWMKDFVKDEETGVSAVDKAIEKAKRKGISLSRYHAIYDIKRQKGQNISNVHHQKTKLILMGLDDMELSVLKHYYDIVNTRDNDSGKIEYKCSKEEEALLHNLAMVEHARWVAAHKLMGFTRGPEKDMVKKEHPDMVNWDDLTEEVKSYDCKVIDTTIRMAYLTALKKNK